MAIHQIQKLSHRHLGVLNWMLANPDRDLQDCARELKYSKGWIYQLVYTDAFQYEYQKRCKELGQIAVHTMGSRLTRMALKVMDKIEDKLEDEMASDRLLESSLKTALTGLGYSAAAQEAGAQQNHLHLHITPELVSEARARAASAMSGTTPLKAGSDHIGEASRTEESPRLLTEKVQ